MQHLLVVRNNVMACWTNIITSKITDASKEAQFSSYHNALNQVFTFASPRHTNSPRSTYDMMKMTAEEDERERLRDEWERVARVKDGGERTGSCTSKGES